MADYNGRLLSALNTYGILDISANPVITISQGISEGLSLKKYYLMRAIDIDCGSLTYRTWVVTDLPDILGSQYFGAKCGSSPLSEIIIAASWEVEL